MLPLFKCFNPFLCFMTLIFPGCSQSLATENKNHDLNHMPTEYLQIVEIVNRIARSNDLGKKHISFTINAGAYAGFLGSKSNGNDEACYYYSALDPYRTYENPDTNEIMGTGMHQHIQIGRLLFHFLHSAWQHMRKLLVRSRMRLLM